MKKVLTFSAQDEIELLLFNENINNSKNLGTFENSLKSALKKYEAQYITAASEQYQYNVIETASLLNIHRSGLYKKLEEYDLLKK